MIDALPDVDCFVAAHLHRFLARPIGRFVGRAVDWLADSLIDSLPRPVDGSFVRL